MPDYKAMQQEAVQRALEMQRRAKKPAPCEPKEPPPEPSSPAQSAEPGSPGFFELLFRDREQSLLLLLLLLLLSEESDGALIFALLYLVL